MKAISILDCTLRDGGYINDWNFGYKNIKEIVRKLVKSHIEFIELGFLEDCKYNKDVTFFSSINDTRALDLDYGDSKLVLMTRYGYLNLDNLEESSKNDVFGIRVTFHMNDVEKAMVYCEEIKEKGYNVFVQPVGTTSYKDSELIKLIESVNSLNPYAFSIVDTLGIMDSNELGYIMNLTHRQLKNNVKLGFHSHNNLQLSLGVVQEVIKIEMERDLIIDSSLFGMGRGAGNLHTELLAQFLISQKINDYNISDILDAIDPIIEIKKDKQWGYSIPYFLASTLNCHPNYAKYLTDKQTLDFNTIRNILQQIPQNFRELYNKQLIKELYSNCLAETNLLEDSTIDLTKEVIVITPGESINSFNDKINDFINENSYTIIAVNFIPVSIKVDYLFYGNIKRYSRDFEILKNNNLLGKLITTTNVKAKNGRKILYSRYVNKYDKIGDNSAIMLLDYLKSKKVTKIHFAGFDGFSLDRENYITGFSKKRYDFKDFNLINKSIKKYLEYDLSSIDKHFITPSRYKRGD